MGNSKSSQRSNTFQRIEKKQGKLKITKPVFARLNLNIQQNNIKMIDHKPQLLSKNAHGIQGVIVYFSQYITGLQVSYCLDSGSQILDLMGSGSYQNQNYIQLGEDEYINHIICYFDDVAMTNFEARTTEGKYYAFGRKEKGHYKKEINLEDDGRGVICFKGLVGEFLSDINIYHTRIYDLFQEKEETCYTAENF